MSATAGTAYEHRVGRPHEPDTPSATTFWVLIFLYSAGRFLQVNQGIPIQLVVVLHVFPLAIFAVLHGRRIYGWRGSAVFVGICLGAGFIFENVGVRTGIPFGRYYFTDVMGPKISVVPIMLALAYVGMGYLSWVLANVITGQAGRALRGPRVITIPLIASLMMVAWDLCLDPVWSTILRAWVWLDGGPYFGVPIKNFAGWFVTVFTVFLLLALSTRASDQVTLPHVRYWRQAIIFYSASAAGNFLLLLPSGWPAVVTDPAGVQWKVAVITAACALVTVFTMGTFAAIAWVRLGSTDS